MPDWIIPVIIAAACLIGLVMVGVWLISVRREVTNTIQTTSQNLASQMMILGPNLQQREVEGRRVTLQMGNGPLIDIVMSTRVETQAVLSARQPSGGGSVGVAFKLPALALPDELAGMGMAASAYDEEWMLSLLANPEAQDCLNRLLHRRSENEFASLHWFPGSVKFMAAMFPLELYNQGQPDAWMHDMARLLTIAEGLPTPKQMAFG